MRQAQAEAVAAERAVIAVSARRLAECLRLAPAERLHVLDDPDLILADRVRLRQSLQAGLRRPPSTTLWPRRWRLSWRRSLVHLRGPALGLVALAGICGVAATRNAEVASLNHQVKVTFRYPNGTTRDETLPANISLFVRRLDATWAEARQWRAREGYLTIRIPISAFTFVH